MLYSFLISVASIRAGDELGPVMGHGATVFYFCLTAPDHKSRSVLMGMLVFACL